MNIGLIGKTGSGKTTLARNIASRLGHEIINSDMLQEYIDLRLDGWQIMQKHMERGTLIPFQLVANALSARMFPLKNKEIIADSLINVKLLQEIEKYQQKIDIVFHLDISSEEAAKRVLSRKRENKIFEHVQNRKLTFLKELPKLKKRLGNKIINIDARQAPEEINAQVLEILGK